MDTTFLSFVLEFSVGSSVEVPFVSFVSVPLTLDEGEGKTYMLYFLPLSLLFPIVFSVSVWSIFSLSASVSSNAEAEGELSVNKKRSSSFSKIIASFDTFPGFSASVVVVSVSVL